LLIAVLMPLQATALIGPGDDWDRTDSRIYYPGLQMGYAA